MTTISNDYHTEQVVLDLSSDEGETLARAFDRAARLPNGKIGDAGWFDVSQALSQAVEACRAGRSATTLDDGEVTIRSSNQTVRFGFDIGLARDVASELRAAIPEVLGDAYYAFADQIEEHARELERHTD